MAGKIIDIDKDILSERARLLTKKDLRLGRYKPMPAIGSNHAKKHGGFRQITRLTALDTVIQQAALEI